MTNSIDWIMVIHDETELVVKLPMIKKPLYEAKSNVIPNKHDEDFENTDENDRPISLITKKSRKLKEDESEVQVRIPRKKSKKSDQSEVHRLEINDATSSASKISNKDLEELRTVYNKCKSVIRKIEAKYGHLLNLDEPGCSRKLITYSTDGEETECHCKLNKKVVFDDDGKEIAVDTVPSDHICPKKSRYSRPQLPPPDNLQIEYYNQTIELPDDLQELREILQNPELEITYRNLVIQKMRSIKQDFVDEIRFNKRSIVDKIKENMEEILDFKGSNLSSIPGYYFY